MYKLSRTRDGAGDSGNMSRAIFPDQPTTEGFGYVTKEDAAPEVGAVMIVGSYSARSYSHQDYWQTTRVTEIVESWTEAFGDHEIEYIRFRTGNSEYIWSKG